MANKHYKKSKKIGIDDKPYNKFLKRLYEKRVRKQKKNSENIEIKEHNVNIQNICKNKSTRI